MNNIKDWAECTFEDLLNYEQPTKYIVESTEYNDNYKTPVLTAGKTFIKGYTNETNGIFENLPVIIFDDFTTASQFVNFKFKVKSSAMKILVPTSKLVDMQFVFYAMQVNKVRNDTHKRYWISVYAKKKLLLPSLVEQRAIVAKIETLFSALDNAIANLKKAQEQLKTYRQAVLKKAFEGELTKEWREKRAVQTLHATSHNLNATSQPLPTAEELLQQIKEERQKHYEKQIENWEKAVKEWKANGKKGKKPSKPKKLKDYINTSSELLNINIPDIWIFDCIGNLSLGVEYGSSAKSQNNGKVPVIRMGNMQNGKIDWKDLKYTSDEKEINQYLLKKGDVLFNRTNSPELVGKTVEYKGGRKAIFAGYLIRINQIKTILNSSYLNWFLNSHPAKIYGSHVKTDGVNQSNINGEKLSNYPIPICSLPEQHQIVAEIEKRLSVVNKMEQSITESLKKAEALRQSILKKAFEGKLLTQQEIEKCKQEPDYEPASVLLEKTKNKKQP